MKKVRILAFLLLVQFICISSFASLHDAILDGDLTRVQEVVAERWPEASYIPVGSRLPGLFTEKDDFGYTAFSLAVNHRQRKIVRFFIQRLAPYGGEDKLSFRDLRAYYELMLKERDPVIQYKYAVMLQNGIGGELIDLPGAELYFRMSARQGYPPAQLAYGHFLWRKATVEEREGLRYIALQEALRSFEGAAQSGMAEAQYYCSVFYIQGLGTERDLRQADIYRALCLKQMRAQGIAELPYISDSRPSTRSGGSVEPRPSTASDDPSSSLPQLRSVGFRPSVVGR